MMDASSPSQIAVDRIGDAAEEFTEEMVAVAILQVKENLGSELGISPSTLSLVIKYTMEAVEKTPTKGPAQMDFALRVIGDLIEELPSSDEKGFLNQTLDNGGIKNTIDLVIQATRGDINVNQVAEVAAKSCLQPCIDYIASKCR
jgi:hypothetical protein